MIVRMLLGLGGFPPRRGEPEAERVHRWLGESNAGRRFIAYLTGEAELLAMTANRLNLSGDEELRDMAREIGRTSDRLWTLVGVRDSERI